jgi:two-component system nitrogen regulation sensor histidine kinase NtrY
MSDQEQKLSPHSSPDGTSSARSDVAAGGTPLREVKKRRREIVLVVFLAALLLFLTLFEFRLAGISEQLPFGHSIFFFGLVNFNIILVLLLFFLIFRNVVKVFVERQNKLIGSSLKSKLIVSFVSFSSIPTALMLMIFVFYINSSLDKWFSVKSISVLKNSLEVNQEYIVSAKKKNYHFANQIAHDLRPSRSRSELIRQMQALREIYAVDAIEYYPSMFGQRALVISKDESIPNIPSVSVEFLKKGLVQNSEGSTIQEFGEGNLVRVIVPIVVAGKRGHHLTQGAVVVSSFIPFSLISKIDGITAAYDELKNLDPLQYPLKSIYIIVLVLMTLVIVLCATWFGFYLARQLSVPIESLGLATQRVSQGDYQAVTISSGSAEINQLIENFNEMMVHLDRSKKDVLQANQNLTEHSRYVQVVLSNVTTGVISVDQSGIITTVNRHASQLLNIDSEVFVGRHLRSVLPEEYFQLFKDLLASMREHNATSLQKEIRLDLGERSIPFQLTLSILLDEKGNDLGKVIVFDDLTPVINAQRAAAWTEVARRIAHEIKNPLTPIKLSAQRLQKKFGAQIQDPAFRVCTDMIIQQTDELKALVNEFHNFARLPQLKLSLSSLHKTIEDALILFRSAHKDLEISFEQDLGLPNFIFDADQMKRVIVNLVDNAVAATLQQAYPKISVRTQYDQELKIVRLSIADNGSGISEENRSRIFEPYFSTKDNGTGLGLAIVKRIVEDHNAFIRALPNEGHGTKIVIEIPVVETQTTLAQNKKALESMHKIEFLENKDTHYDPKGV